MLSGLLETPESDIKFYALFAHCFTCCKDVTAARISKVLTAKGINGIKSQIQKNLTSIIYY